MKCICWKPTAPNHQIDCPVGRTYIDYMPLFNPRKPARIVSIRRPDPIIMDGDDGIFPKAPPWRLDKG